jgi:spore germination protein KA
MVRNINKKVRGIKLRKLNEQQEAEDAKLAGEGKPELSANLDDNISEFNKLLGDSPDIIMRKFSFGQNPRYKAVLFFIDGMTDKTIINQNIIKPLMYDLPLLSGDDQFEIKNIEELENLLLSVGDVKVKKSYEESISSILYGNTILLVDGMNQALDIDTKGWKARSIEKPANEQAVRGPREGFTEVMRTNTSLLRRKILNTDLTLEQMVIGTKTRTNVTIAYIKGIARPELVEEVKKRLSKIKIDEVLESGYVEQLIEDAPYSIFSTVGNTEKPDIAAALLLEGRVAIIIDGTPFVLTVPMLFVEGFQASEDYYSRFYYASLVRILRFFAFFVSITAPAAYVALTTFHQEFIPTPLLITMAMSVQGVPFPALAQTILMGVMFEVLREGGIRLPQQVGHALSIVGALVIGQAAVEAGLVDQAMVIVISLTAISSFLVGTHTDASTIIRFTLVLLAGILGSFGIVIGLLAFLVHLINLTSFGVPYLAPFAPVIADDLKDTVVRAPLWAMLKRPKSIGSMNINRQSQ